MRTENRSERAEVILAHLAEIGAGRCTIDDTRIAAESDLEMRQILVGLLVLHEDLAYARELHERADAERARVSEERAQLLIEREAAISARDDFLAVASHELRTPLTTMSLELETFAAVVGREPDVSSELLVDRIARVRRQVRRLSELVREMLDVSCITSGRLSLDEDTVDLGALTLGVVERFDAESVARNARVSVDIGGTVVGRWDASRVDQVLSNLLSNALKYGANQPIDVKVWSNDGWAHVAVVDRGIGISREDQAKIFAPFARAVSSQRFGGLGLGLWIVEQVVRASGGSVSVESEPGSGARFTVDLPQRKR